MLSNQDISYKLIHQAIERLNYSYPTLTPRTCVVGIDTTYFGRSFGVTIFRDVTNKATLHWVFVRKENIQAHIDGINYLKENGITVLGFVVDGFWSFFTHYRIKYDIQMCQKHMADLIRRETTLKPKLQASKELKILADKLTDMKSKIFILKYNEWLTIWNGFLKEKSYSNTLKKWMYTHEGLRKVVRSINKYLPYLLTSERNKWIPNTNNSLEGFNSGLKTSMKIHNGLRADRKAKLIHHYLRKKSDFKWGK